MSTEQQEQLIAFVATMTSCLADDKMPVIYALEAVQMAVSCLLAAVFHLGKDAPDGDVVSAFSGSVISAAFIHFYGAQPEHRAPLQA